MLTNRFEEALVYAARLHKKQTRKGSGIPYIAHLLGVTSLVLENKGGEDEAIAALLHDAVEDQGGRATLVEIRQRFGERVASIVDGLTDSYQTPKPPWRKRKEEYIYHLRQASPEVRLVSLADKVNNARSILHDHAQVGDMVWDRFRGGLMGTLWYYRSLLDVFLATGNDPLTREFKQLVLEMERLASHNHEE